MRRFPGPWLFAGLLLVTVDVARAGIPALPDLPGEIQKRYRDPLLAEWTRLGKEREAIVKDGRALNADCVDVEKDSAKHRECLDRASRFTTAAEALRPPMDALGEAVCVAKVLSELCPGVALKEPGNPEKLPKHILKRFGADYSGLQPKWQVLTRQTTEFCAASPATLSQQTGCAGLKDGYATDRFAYAAREKTYAEELKTFQRWFPLPRYREYDHGLILGLTATGGFNVPPGSSEAMRKKSEKSFIDQQHKIQEGPAVSAQGYDFVIGMAKIPEIALHAPQELLRGLMDNALLGAYSAYERELYPAIKARSFDRLECHSNGAMVCLTALGKGDIAAREVKLFGPQITISSLPVWAQLVKDGRVEKIDLYWLKADPIPLVAIRYDPRALLGTPSAYLDAAESALLSAVGTNPALPVHVLDCPQIREVSLDNPFACHRVQLYQMGAGVQ